MTKTLSDIVADSNMQGHDPATITALLAGIQGNILEPHGRGHAVHVLIKFKPGKEAEARKWVAAFRPSSALEERGPAPPPVFKMLALAKSGYEALGIRTAAQPASLSFSRGLDWYDGAHDGYAGTGTPTGNPLSRVHALAILASDTEADLAGDAWKMHAGLAGPDRRPDFCSYEVAAARLMSAGAGNVRRDGRRSKASYYIEHFGFHDGISNPAFYKGSRSAVVPGDLDPSGRYGHWNGFAPLSLVMSEEAPADLSNPFGSYLAFLKLEQDVPGFLRSCRMLALQFAVDDVADALRDDLRSLPNSQDVKRKWQGKHPDFATHVDEFDRRMRLWEDWNFPRDRDTFAGEYADSLRDDSAFRATVLKANPTSPLDIEQAGAMAVGRYRNGTPAFLDVKTLEAAIAPEARGSANDFTYLAADPGGARCPFHAHTRRMNPRGEFGRLPPADRPASDSRAASPEAERRDLIVRRGMSYGERDDASLDNRYAYAPSEVDGYAPPAAAASTPGERGLLFMSFQASFEQFETMAEVREQDGFFSVGAPRDWPRPSDAGRTTRFTFDSYIALRGGAYLFAPSLEYLANIEKYAV